MSHVWCHMHARLGRISWMTGGKLAWIHMSKSRVCKEQLNAETKSLFNSTWINISIWYNPCPKGLLTRLSMFIMAAITKFTCPFQEILTDNHAGLASEHFQFSNWYKRRCSDVPWISTFNSIRCKVRKHLTLFEWFIQHLRVKLHKHKVFLTQIYR